MSEPGPDRTYTDEELQAALAAVSSSERLAEAQALVGRIVPQLSTVLAEALEAGGWFGQAHEAEVLKAAGKPEIEERLRAVRTLVAEETRIGMLVGVAVGLELARELKD